MLNHKVQGTQKQMLDDRNKARLKIVINLFAFALIAQITLGIAMIKEWSAGCCMFV